MSSACQGDAHQRQFKNTNRHEDMRRRRTETSVELRKQKKEEQLMKRRNVEENDENEPLSPLSPDQKAGEKQDLPLEECVAILKGGDHTKAMDAIASLRRMLSRTRNPPIDKVLDAGLLPYLVRCLAVDDRTVQFEASWALTNIVSGTSEQTQAVVKAGALPFLVNLLAVEELYVNEQATWCLGNIAGDSALHRDLVIQNGAVPHFIRIIKREDISVKYLQTMAWTISNCVRNKNPYPPIEVVGELLPVILELMHCVDETVVCDSCWAISYITDGPNDRIQEVLDAGCLPRLVQLLLATDFKLVGPALRSLGNIVTGSDEQTQAVIDANILFTAMQQLLSSPRSSVVKETVWMLSNIAAGNSDQIQSILNANLLSIIMELSLKGERKVRGECAWFFANFCSGATVPQVYFLISSGVVKPLCDLLDIPDLKIITVVLDTIKNLLTYANKMGTLEQMTLAIEEHGGLDRIEKLQEHDNSDIYKQALSIIEQYFTSDEETNLAITGDEMVFVDAPPPSSGFHF